MLAKQTGIDELAIDLDEGKQVLSAAQKVMAHYSIEATQKAIDIAALIGTLGAVYGTRAIAIMNNKKKVEKKVAKVQPLNVSTPNVVPMTTHSIISDEQSGF